jgi:hypothetical protein
MRASIRRARMKAAAAPRTPTYSDEEVFVLLDMQYGSPPVPVTPGTRWNNVERARREDEYFNNVTAFIMAACPDGGIVKVVELRRAFYLRHGIMSFDFLSSRQGTR